MPGEFSRLPGRLAAARLPRGEPNGIDPYDVSEIRAGATYDFLRVSCVSCGPPLVPRYVKSIRSGPTNTISRFVV
jgi:hypothetical protein